MNTISAVSATVIGARHARMARNGQDAAASWLAADGSAGAIVVCDGCGAGASSEVGARLGVRWTVAAIAAGLARGDRPSALWPSVRAAVTRSIAAAIEPMCAPGDDRAQVVHDHFLFTIVAAAVAGDEVSVWAIGDGGYAIGDRVRALAPFADNQPPYLAYDVLGIAADAHVETCDARAGSVIVASDGAAALDLVALVDDRALGHRDGLRRRLARCARGDERIDWQARRVVRTPAALQDDGAVAALVWEGARS